MTQNIEKALIIFLVTASVCMLLRTAFHMAWMSQKMKNVEMGANDKE